MKILVQKFGGTSVATVESRELVYNKILSAKENGYSVVVVISAMGRKGAPYATDTLLDLIRLDCPEANLRELDLIFSCGEIISGTLITANLQKKGYPSVYLTGQQAGIVTTKEHGDARILCVKTENIMRLLSEGNIVVVAGGQGAAEDGSITTLGRGGSDTTGCALGVALDAERIEIYTDVEGIMTVDPRLVSNARLITEISYDDCCEMAYQGAKIMHPRAVEIASQKPSSQLYVRSVFSDNPGTLICSIRHKLPFGADLPINGGPVGLALLDKQVAFKVKGLVAGQKSEILDTLKDMKISIQDIHPETMGMILVAEEKDTEKVKSILNSLSIDFECQIGLNKISMVGENLTASPKFLASVITVLENNSIPIIATVACNNVISAWVGDKKAEAVKAIHSLL